MARGFKARQRRRLRRRELDKAREEETLVAAATGSTDLPLGGRNDTWDAGAARKSLQPEDFPKAHFWRDDGAPADQITSYKFPFARRTDGGLQAVWRGVTAGAARLPQAKGVNVDAIQSKMSSYYSAAAKKYDDPSIKPPWKSGSSAESESFEAEEPKPRRHLTRALAGKSASKPPPPNRDDDQEPDEDQDEAAPNMGLCSNCSHAARAHAGEMNDGACSMVNCSCSKFEASQRESEEADSGKANISLPTAYITIDPSRAEFEGVIRTTLGEVNTSTSSANVTSFNLVFTDTTNATDGEVPALPDEHSPGQQMPRRHPSPQAPKTVPLGGSLNWVATLAPEGKATDDGRIFAPGSITWRELPLSLMAMTKTADGHDGAEIAGRIDKIWRDGDGPATMIRASGVFDTGEFGQEIARMVSDGTLSGVSVDIAPQKVEVAYRKDVVDDDGVWKGEPSSAETDSEVEEPSLVDLLLGNPDEPVIYVVRDAVLGMATVCPFQAFADAKIEVGNSLASSASSPMVWTVSMNAGWQVVQKLSGLTASGANPTLTGESVVEAALTASAAGIAPETPPLDWFTDPQLPELTALTVTPDGRVYGHAAPWGICHIGLPGGCTTAPRTATNYSYFHLKEIETDDGTRMSVGTITLDTGHAEKSLSRAGATRHYDDTGIAVADVRVGEDEHGIWVAGALRGDVDELRARKLRGAALSGDWRNVDGNLELVALLAVNVPGFPIPRPAAALVAAGEEWEVESLVAAGVHMGIAGLTKEEREQFEALRVAAQGEPDWDSLLDLARAG